MNLKPEQKRKLITTYPELAPLLEQQETNVLLRELVTRSREEDNAFRTIKGLIRGEDGKDGVTPVKGQDYFTDEDIQNFLEAVTPEKGVHYFTDEEISNFLELATPQKGRDYQDGKDGDKGEPGQPGKDAPPTLLEDLITRLNTIPKVIKSSTIDGIPTIEEIHSELTKKGSKYRFKYQDLDMSDLRWHGGGLSTVVHDATLTGNGTTTSPLSVVSGGGTGYQVAVGTVNGVNTSFTFAVAPHVISRDGIVMQKVQSDGTINWTGTTNVTLAVAPNFDVFGLA